MNRIDGDYNQYNFQFDICEPLDDACPDTADAGQGNACGSRGSAMGCQSWAGSSVNATNTVCIASANYAPSFSYYSS
jgi:hypothetical protein